MKSKVRQKHLITLLIALVVLLVVLFSFSVQNDSGEEEITEDYLVEEVMEIEGDIPGEGGELPTVEGGEEVRSSQEVIINIKSLRFEPDKIIISPGTTVVWVNTDSVSHKVVAYDRLFYGQRMALDDKYAFTFTQEGTHRYFDAVFPKIGRGTIIVKEEPLPITGQVVGVDLDKEEANGKLSMIILLFVVMIFSLSKGMHMYYA